MPNHFPAPPGGLLLASVAYQAAFPEIPATVSSGPLLFAGAPARISGAAAQAGSWGLTYSFTTPGDPGAYDQDLVEFYLARWLSAMALAATAATGAQESDVAAAVQVSRIWTWVSADREATLGWRDTSWDWQAALALSAPISDNKSEPTP